jgi:hypothetical protein
MIDVFSAQSPAPLQTAPVRRDGAFQEGNAHYR